MDKKGRALLFHCLYFKFHRIEQWPVVISVCCGPFQSNAFNFFIAQICCHTVSNLQNGNGQRDSFFVTCSTGNAQLMQRTAQPQRRPYATPVLFCHLRHSPSNPTAPHPPSLSATQMHVAHCQSYSGVTLHPNAHQGDLEMNKVTQECGIERLVKNVICIIHDALQKTHNTQHSQLRMGFYHFKCFIYTKGGV